MYDPGGVSVIFHSSHPQACSHTGRPFIYPLQNYNEGRSWKTQEQGQHEVHDTGCILRDRDPFPGIYILAQGTRVHQEVQWL